MNNKLDIPAEWTFKSKSVANNFDSHVREQLPWYDMATRAVAHIGRHYIPREGLVYDIGASTGNMENALYDTLAQRNAKMVAIEESPQMCEQYRIRRDAAHEFPPTYPFELTCANAIDYDYKMFDFAVCFLSLMFFPVAGRGQWIGKMVSMTKPGGAFVIVDKITTPSGYAGTVIRRMAMQWKQESGTSAEDIVAKELSLAGYQRPINPHVIEAHGQSSLFFMFGEFAGWVIERKE